MLAPKKTSVNLKWNLHNGVRGTSSCNTGTRHALRPFLDADVDVASSLPLTQRVTLPV